MPQNWKTYKLEDALEALIDYRGKTPKKTDSGIPLVTAKIVKNGRVEEPNEFIAVEDYDTWMRRGIPEIGDVVLTVEAPLGEVAQLKDANIALAQRIVTLRGKKGVLDSGFLKYFLQSPIGQSRLEARQSGTTVFGVKQSELRKVLIDCPAYQEQHSIARILSALDDKIELNLAMNRTLEDMAMALYKHWFVDFGPFQDQEFIDSELGMIPKGWEVKRLGEVTTKIGSGATPRGGSGVYVNSGPSLIRSQNIYDFVFKRDGLVFITDEAAQKLKGVTVQANDVLINITGDSILRTSIVDRGILPARVNQHVAIVRARPEIGSWLIHLHLLKMKDWLMNHSVGGTRKAVTKSDLESVPVPIPNSFLKLKPFNDQVVELYQLINNNWQENQTLTALRDTLLPKLISGEVRVKDAEQMLNEVL